MAIKEKDSGKLNQIRKKKNEIIKKIYEKLDKKQVALQLFKRIE